MPTDIRVIGDRATSVDRIESVQGRVSIARIKKEKCRSDLVDRTGGRPARKVDIGKIDHKGIALIQLRGHHRRLRSGSCRAFLLSRTSSRKLSPARSRIHCLRSRGSFWKRPLVTMFN